MCTTADGHIWRIESPQRFESAQSDSHPTEPIGIEKVRFGALLDIAFRKSREAGDCDFAHVFDLLCDFLLCHDCSLPCSLPVYLPIIDINVPKVDRRIQATTEKGGPGARNPICIPKVLLQKLGYLIKVGVFQSPAHSAGGLLDLPIAFRAAQRGGDSGLMDGPIDDDLGYRFTGGFGDGI